MDEKPYTFPPLFQPYLAADALAGITQAMFEKLDNGPPDKEPESTEYWMELSGLIYASRVLAKQMHEYLDAIDLAGHRVPIYQEELARKPLRVEEPPAVYRVI
ncbi:MAG: hypothetical protein MJA83_20570 [Gammaproteobacteria bacterium]|nr:hypothetical protein [Gammaproteobacteria bacterium]